MQVSKRGLDIAKKRIEGLKGLEVHLKVNEGRNRFVEYFGTVSDMYEGIFTVRSRDDGKIFSYPYSDLITKNVMFYRK